MDPCQELSSTTVGSGSIVDEWGVTRDSS